MKLNSLQSCLIGLLLLISNNFLSQIAISNTAPNNDPNHLIQNILSGGGVTITNVTFTEITNKLDHLPMVRQLECPQALLCHQGMP